MILSKIQLMPGKLHNAWEWHRALWTLFPDIDRTPNKSSPFLYRIENLDLARGAQLLVQSTQQPIPQSDNAKLLATREINPAPVDGQHLHFLLTANVTKTIRDKDKPERKLRVPLINETEKIAWLHRKFQRAAVDINHLHIRQHPPTYFRKHGRSGKIVATTFEGEITVTDTKTLLSLLTSGIGPAKAFGCGLLLIKRAY